MIEIDQTHRFPLGRWIVLFSLVWHSSLIGFSELPGDSEPELDPQLKTRLEVLGRIDPSVYRSSEKIRVLVDETLTALSGRPALVDLAFRFGVTNRTEAVLTVLGRHPDHPSGSRALAWLFKSGNGKAIAHWVAEEKNVSLLPVLARTPSSEARDIVIPFCFDPKLDSKLAQSVLTGICLQKAGAKKLLQELRRRPVAETGDVIGQAWEILQQTPWNGIRADLAALLPEAAPFRPEPLPERSVLLGRSGDAERGKAVFRLARNTCVNCHRIEGVGIGVGPDLSEIGKKLGKEALYEAILKPDAGISVGYEGWELMLESGDELSGIVLSEEDGQLTLRNLLGESLTVAEKEIFEKRRMATSLMPSGLGEAIGAEDLVDLVEYLSRLGR